MTTTIKKISAPVKAVLTALTGVAIWSVAIERMLPVVRNEELPLLSNGKKPIRILQLSDLHLAPWQNKKIRWVRSLAKLNPDLVVLTGDLLGHSKALPALDKALGPFAGVPGVYVHGSNDYYGPILKNPFKYLRKPNRRSTRIPDLDTPKLENLLSKKLGFHSLNNTAKNIFVKDQNMRFFGLNDPHIRYDNVAEMTTALQKIDGSHADVRIGVVHAPYQESLDELVRLRSDLIFAGHTHGGQLRIPGFGALTSNSDLPPAQARGLSVWYDSDHAAYLQVSAGLGNSIFAPIRFGCRPEVTVVTLQPR